MNNQELRIIQVQFDQALVFFDEFTDDVWQFLSDDQVQKVIDESISLERRALAERDDRKARAR